MLEGYDCMVRGPSEAMNSVMGPSLRPAHQEVYIARSLVYHLRASGWNVWTFHRVEAHQWRYTLCKTLLEACAHCQKAEQQSSNLKEELSLLPLQNDWNHAALRREQLDDNMGLIIQKCKMESVLSGRTSLTAVPSTNSCWARLNCRMWEMACWSAMGS
jgi:hypothetical protein